MKEIMVEVTDMKAGKCRLAPKDSSTMLTVGDKVKYVLAKGQEFMLTIGALGQEHPVEAAAIMYDTGRTIAKFIMSVEAKRQATEVADED